MPKVIVVLPSAIYTTTPESLTIDIEGDSISSILIKLCNELGEKIREAIFRTKDMAKLKKNIWILVNGRNINHLDGLNTKLHEDDVVVICKDLKSFRLQVLQRRSIALKLKPLKIL
jgi:molybdopterin converting factor small subunit